MITETYTLFLTLHLCNMNNHTVISLDINKFKDVVFAFTHAHCSLMDNSISYKGLNYPMFA
jgi:hypothetical protein